MELKSSGIQWRLMLMMAQNGGCFYCGQKFIGKHKGRPHRRRWTEDHLTPRSKGGPDVPRNIVLSCEPCNTMKANSPPTPQELNRAARIWRRLDYVLEAYLGEAL